MSLLIKICGLKDERNLDAALGAGADLVGLVFHLASPRNIGVAVAAGLRRRATGKAGIVALTVNASDRDLDEIVARVQPEWLQLHGSETPERVAELKARHGIRTIKSVPIRGRGDLDAANDYDGIADMILFDAKPPVGAILPGGNGIPFNWKLLRGETSPRPFMVSGGLNAGNVAEAIATMQPDAVDVSSGVETEPGKKDPNLIQAFVAAARTAARPGHTAAAE
jgi:phosphoribosylanthranilate isomerase